MHLKRIFIFSLVSVIMVFCFSGCYAGHSDNSVNEPTSKLETRTYDEDEINETNAVSLIKSYTSEELGLSGSINDYTFLIASERVVMDDESYYKVVAGIVNESGKNNIYNIEEINHYLVSAAFDRIFVYDRETDCYNVMENAHQIPNIEQ